MRGANKIALFIDGANLHHATKSLGFDIDFKRLLTEFGNRGELVRAYFYTTISETTESSGIRPLIDWLSYNGFSVKTKPEKEFDDGEGRRRIKRNIDVDLTVDALDISPSLDEVYIFSGDGDLVPLVESLQRRGVRVAVVSSILTAPPMIASELRRRADIFIELNTLRPSIERSSGPSGIERRAPSR